MAKVIKFPRNHNSKKDNPYQEEYETFIDDVGGFLWNIRMMANKGWEAIARDIGLAPMTLVNLANRKTKNPQGRTIWCVLRGLDNRQIIRHSMLEQYRGIDKKAAQVVIREHEKRKAKG